MSLRHNNFKKALSLLVCTALLFGSTPASAISFGFKASASVKAEVGLDAKTRALIQQLPAEIRQQVLLLLEQALPMIDTSVNSYLTRVNEILESQVDHIGCTLTGSGKTIVDELGHILGGTPTPIADLEKQAVRLQTAFKLNTDPGKYRTEYADFLVRGRTTACSAAAVPEALVIINRLRADASNRARVWNRVIDTGCSNAEACLVQLRDSVKQTLDSAAQADVQAVDAYARFQQVELPKRPGMFQQFRQDAYENAMAQLYFLEDGIRIAKEIRLAFAQQLMSSAEDKLKSVEASVAAGRANLSRRALPPNKIAITSIDATGPLIIEGLELINEAVKLNPSLESNRTAYLQRTETLRAEGAGIRRTAEENMKRIELIFRNLPFRFNFFH